MILQGIGIHRKAGVAILVSDKIHVKITEVTRDKIGYFIMIKGTLHQDVTLLNTYAPSQGAPQYKATTKRTLRNWTENYRETDKNTIILEELQWYLTAIDRSSKQKISKEILALKDTLDQMDVIAI